jgi:hypothetical protein
MNIKRKIAKQEFENLKIQTKRKEAKHKEHVDKYWVIKIILLSFCLALVFDIIAEIAIPNVNIILGIIILILFIGIGILFDMIGVAVTAADETSFHSMASRKVKGANVAVKLKKNADKVSSFCNDVIGDICGIISGSVGVIISSALAHLINFNTFTVTLITTSLIASITIGFKALCKSLAINKANIILYEFAKTISNFYKPKK